MTRNIRLANPILTFSGFGLLVTLAVFYSPVLAGKQGIPEPVLTDSSYNLYKSGNFYLSGQPTEENLKALVNDGVKLIINIRTAPEMEEFGKTHYNEEELVKSLKADYLNIGVGGSDGFKPEVIKKISDKITATNGKVLIHCAAAGRATMVWMAWLVQKKFCTIDEAIRLGKKAKFTFPFGDLLGYPLTIQRAD
jgi:protein tyrosine phosphatase (PTP) superfamily phosphohydrolase (DUF442 family)